MSMYDCVCACGGVHYYVWACTYMYVCECAVYMCWYVRSVSVICRGVYTVCIAYVCICMSMYVRI